MHWFQPNHARHADTTEPSAVGLQTPARRGLLQRFIHADAGNFAIITALLLPVLMGFAALAVEYGMALLSRGTNQRVADIAAFSGALEYSKGESEAAMRDIALHAAKVNGIDPDDVRVSLVPSPRGDGKAVHVRIVTTSPVVLGTILGASSEVLVGAESFAAVGAQGQPSCVLALDGSQSGIILSGGTSLSANNCSVASNATIAVPCGTTVTAQVVYYDTKVPTQGCNGIRGPAGAPGKIEKVRTEDPLAKHPNVLAATGRIPLVAAITAPPTPTVPSRGAINFAWGNDALVKSNVAAAGCTATGAMPNWTVVCPDNGGTYSFGPISASADAKVQFDVNSTRLKTYTVSGAINISGSSTIAFGPGNFQVTQGILTSGAASASFGAGTFSIGKASSGCGAGHSICAASSGVMSFGGPSTFNLVAGFYTGGGATLRLGAGTTNRFALGAASDGNAISLGGGSNTVLADALGADDTFRIRGNINGGGGGSCFMVSAAPHHDIAGSFVASGAIVLGAGVYTLDGAFLLGGGGAAPCGGATVSVRAIDVTIVLSGKKTVSSSACPNQTFCISAGYSNVVFRAPKTGATAGLAVVGPTDGKTDGATLSGGAGNAIISGAFYFPTGPIVMSGGAGLGGGGTDTCLQLVGSRIDLSGGSSAASDCLGNGTGGKRERVVLVQ